MSLLTNIDLINRARQIIPGGVNSPVRAFSAVNSEPLFIDKAFGPYIQDVHGRIYVDYVGSWGPMVNGHAHPTVIAKTKQALTKGLSFGASTSIEIELAEFIQSKMPSLEMIRMVNSGTEATMSAIRLARGFTGRNKILKFNGNYHGHSDALLVKAGSGAMTLGISGSAGVPESMVSDTLTANFNDFAAVEQLFHAAGKDLACVIVEPIAGNMNFVLPKPGFLHQLRKLCDQYNTLLIFDEVMTGFRVHPGGAQSLYNITPDLTTLGKVIGGGLPVGAFGGRREIMQQLAPIGPVYQAGTLSGNPIAMTAGLANLEVLFSDNNFQKMCDNCAALIKTIKKYITKFKLDANTDFAGGMFGISFNNDSDNAKFISFFHSMLANGVYLAPSAYEAGFISNAHDSETLALSSKALELSMAKIAH